MTFTFKEIPSQDMGVKIITMSGVQRAPCEPQITSIPGRYNPLILEKQERQTTEITAELLVECPDNIRNIFSWLLGRGKLIFSDEPDKYYNVISDDVISIQRIDDRIQSFEIKFICEPFAYSVTNPFVSTPMGMDDDTLTGSMTIINNGTAESEPNGISALRESSGLRSTAAKTLLLLQRPENIPVNMRPTFQAVRLSITTITSSRISMLTFRQGLRICFQAVKNLW